MWWYSYAALDWYTRMVYKNYKPVLLIEISLRKNCFFWPLAFPMQCDPCKDDTYHLGDVANVSPFWSVNRQLIVILVVFFCILSVYLGALYAFNKTKFIYKKKKIIESWNNIYEEF